MKGSTVVMVDTFVEEDCDRFIYAGSRHQDDGQVRDRRCTRALPR